MALLSVALTVTFVLATVIYFYLKKRHRFWSDRGVPCAPDPHLLFGNVQGVIGEKHGSYINQKLYQAFKRRDLAFGGYSFFTIPSVMVVDPELIKTVMVRDFNVFHDRGIYNDPQSDPLSGHLFLLEGAPWRNLRQKLTPTFTSGRMKSMFGTILEVADEFRKFMVEHHARGECELEMKDVLARFTTDVIGTCAFGLECNTLKNPESDFLKYGKKVFQQSPLNAIKFVLASTFKKQAKKFGVKLTDVGVERFFLGLTRETVEYREKNNVLRNDFMNLLLQIKNKGQLVDQVDEPKTTGKVEPGLTMDELAAQCFVFFVAGFETSSTTMNFCLYELAMNPDVQERLRDEIEQAIAANDGQLSYDALIGMQYLDNVVNETLRKYPPIESLNRIPLSDYTIAGTNHVIPSRTMFLIPVYALHHDPEIYPDPERFDPDRFLPEAVAGRHAYSYLPFGEGPRVCIGLRFGVMQTKIGLITLLRSFRFSPTASTPSSLVFDPKSFVLSPIGGELFADRPSVDGESSLEMDGVQSFLVAIFVTLALAVAATAWLFLDKRRNYWKLRNFPCTSDPVLFFGDYKDTNKTEHMSKTNQRLYQQFKARKLPVGGSILFIVNSAIVVDPELIKAILVKDFATFHDRGVYSNPEVDPLSGHLFALEGQAWRQLRMKLSPTFTSGKMKLMFETILGVADDLRSFLVEKVASDGSAELTMKDVLGGFTTDVIGSCAFGLQCNSLRGERCEVRELTMKVFQQSKLQVLKGTFMMLFKGFATAFKMKSLPTDVETFFMDLVRDAIHQREKNNVKRNDFMNLLIQMKNSENPDERITTDEMAAQSFVFFLAGFETSSTAMVNCMYELAMNPEIQEKLRTEIKRVCGAGKLSYEAVNSVEYLNMVIDETLRKHPSVDFLMRATNSDYPVPDSDLTIPKGTFLIIPTYAIQHDPEYYPDPDRFDPERFSEVNRRTRHPFVYLPFGEGPRNCIGMRFGLMQIRVGLITILREYRVKPGPNTPVPLELDLTSNMPMPKGGVPLVLERI